MEDEKILQLYLDRNELAIHESAEKYGAYCRTVAMNILGDPDDAEECVNDTWFKAWNAIPPASPTDLRTYLGKISRNLAFDRYRTEHRDKRGSGEEALLLDELEEIVSGHEDASSSLIARELLSEIRQFLALQTKEKRVMFVRRYWYADSVSAIADRLGTSENRVSVTLNRLRKKLKDHLNQRGYDL